jgi:hypothetical protein
MRPPTDKKEMESLPHKIMMSPSPWDPTILDHQIDSDDNDFYNTLKDSNVTIHEHANKYSQYCQVFYNKQSLAVHSYLVDDYHLLHSCIAHDSKDPIHMLDDQRLLEYVTFNHTIDKVLAQDNPVTCALYAQEKGLLDLPGWKQFRNLARRQKKLFRMANQAKLCSFRTAPKYMYGIEIPRDYQHALKKVLFNSVIQ